MHIGRRALLAGLLGLVAASAMAQGMGFGLGMHDVVVRGGGPAGLLLLDTITTSSGAYGFRKLRTAYAGNAMLLLRASDSTTLAVGFTGNDYDTTAAATFCNATPCGLQVWYDQSGSGRDIQQLTAANQHVLVFNCDGALPCFRMTVNTQSLVSSVGVTPATGVVSLAVVAKRSAGTALCTLLRENGPGNRLQTNNGANSWTLQPTGISATATDSVWHAGIGVLHPTAGLSVLRIDDTETTGTTVPTITAGAIGIIGAAASTTCDENEAMFWDNYVLSPAERATIVANQRAYGLIP